MESFNSFHRDGVWTKHRTLFTSMRNLFTFIFLIMCGMVEDSHMEGFE